MDLIARVRKNIKAVEYSGFDKVLLGKRSLVETVFDALKDLCQIEHKQHRRILPVFCEAKHCAAPLQ